MSDTDWSVPLKIYFSSIYGTTDAYTEEIATLNKLRQDVRGAGKDQRGRDILYRYYAQLELLELRIPFNESGCRINFTWQDAHSKEATTQHSIAYEKASLLFNLAAINSSIATEAEDLKLAYKAFQDAAGIYTFIFDQFLHAPSTDLTQETTKALSKLMLAQAQESFVEQLMSNENSKPLMIAKLASGASNMYKSCSELLQNIFNDKSWGQKAWYQFSQIKTKYYLAVSHAQQAKHYEAAGKYGDAIAHTKVAMNKLQEVSSMTIPQPFSKFSDDISNLGDALKESLVVLEKDNDFIYHATIPSTSTIGEIPSLDAAKPTPLSNLYKNEDVAKIIGKELFEKVIPLSVTKQTSLYSEEKAKLLRAEDEKVEIANEELASALEFLNLPAALSTARDNGSDILSMGSSQNVDSKVNDWAAQVSGSTPVAMAFSELDDMRRNVYSKVKEAKSLVETEAKEYFDNKSRFRERWTQADSSLMNTGLYDDINRIENDLSNATTSDAVLRQSITQYQPQIDVLYMGPSNAQLLKEFEDAKKPSTPFSSSNSQSLLDIDNSDDHNLPELLDDTEALLSKLNKLKKERAATFTEFKDKVHKDDISSLLVLNKKVPDIEETLFKSELAKFQPYQTRFEQMNERQQELLKQLTYVWKQVLENPSIREKKKAKDEYTLKHNALVERYQSAFLAWKDFQAGIQKGLEFYRNMNKFTDSVLSNAREFVNNRREESSKLSESLQNSAAQHNQDLLREQLARLSVSSSSSGSTEPSYPNLQYQQQQQQQPPLPAHPNTSSNSLYGSAPSYQPQQPSYYPQQSAYNNPQSSYQYQAPPPPLPPQPQRQPSYGGGYPGYQQPPMQPSQYMQQPPPPPPPGQKDYSRIPPPLPPKQPPSGGYY